MTNPNKREQLINSAAELFYRKGLNATSLEHIAKHAGIAIGNVHYYFKDKETLALAAVEKRKQQFAAAYAMLNEAFDDPRQRLIEATRYFDKVRDQYTHHGCPIAKILDDADVGTDTVAKAAAQVFVDFVNWAAQQFQALGHAQQDARTYAVSLLSGIQGAVVMAKAFNNPQIITFELERLVAWLGSIPNRRIQLGKISLKTANA